MKKCKKCKGIISRNMGTLRLNKDGNFQGFNWSKDNKADVKLVQCSRESSLAGMCEKCFNEDNK